MDGNDKPLLTLGGRTLLNRVIGRLRPQCDAIIISGNGLLDRFAGTSLPVVPDPVPDFPGPLAGVLAGMEWVTSFRPCVRWVVSVPCDTPFLPHDLVLRLQEACSVSGKPIASAASGGRIHHAAALWSVDLRQALREALEHKGAQSIRGWTASQGATHVAWADTPVDPFFNINTLQDLAAAETMVEWLTVDL